MEKNPERSEIAWLFGVIIACLLLAFFGSLYVNRGNPGLAQDNVVSPGPATSVDIATRKGTASDEVTRTVR